ncbi:unnamed protein product [Phaeothamnion confervicola]
MRCGRRRVEYFHHLLAIGYGMYITFFQKYSCGPDMPIKNLYTYAQINEFSTPFYGMLRLSKSKAHAMMFAASFFFSRIVWNFVTLIPSGVRHCSFIGNMMVTIPYQGLQCTWMVLIVRKGIKMSSGDGEGGKSSASPSPEKAPRAAADINGKKKSAGAAAAAEIAAAATAGRGKAATGEVNSVVTNGAAANGAAANGAAANGAAANGAAANGAAANGGVTRRETRSQTSRAAKKKS